MNDNQNNPGYWHEQLLDQIKRWREQRRTRNEPLARAELLEICLRYEAALQPKEDETK